jgi:hypothetical protein
MLPATVSNEWSLTAAADYLSRQNSSLLQMSRRNLRFWGGVAAFLYCGYSMWGRAFAYIGIHSIKLFIGDLALVLFVICCSRVMEDFWLRSLLCSTPLSAVSWSFTLFLFYGVLECARGLASGQESLPAIQELVFNVYPIFFFMGLVAALVYPDLLGKIVRFMAFTSCVWGLVYYLFFRDVTIKIPGTSEIILDSGGAALALVGLNYLDLRRWWPIVAISAFLTLAGQVRGVWLGVSIALVVQAILAKQIARLFWGFGTVAILLVLGWSTDFEIPSPAGRGGAVSSPEIIARAIAAVDQDAAQEYSPRNADYYAGTASWRQVWWREIWFSAHEDAGTALLGHGYGYPLNTLVPYLRGMDDLRTPHSVFYFALGYTGWIGVALFFGFQAALGLILFRAWRFSGDTFGFSVWASSIVSAMFENTYETPFGAIPQYLMLGMAAVGALNSWNGERSRCEPMSESLQHSASY